MGNYDLQNTFLKAHNHNSDAMLKIILKFDPLLRKYEKMLCYDVAYADLVIDLMEKIYFCDIEKIKKMSEGQLVNYISRIVRNKSTDLFRKHSSSINIVLLEETHIVGDLSDSDSLINFYDMLRPLSIKQKNVLTLRFVYNFSDIEIGQILHVSRQSVNRIYNRALKNLRNLEVQ